MYPSSLPPLKVPGGQSNATRTSNTLWALRPSAALWNRIPSQSNPIFRARHMLNKLLHSPAQELISWSNNNVIAVASSEPYNSIENISHQSQSGLSWPLYLILPDHPSDVYLVKEYTQRLISVNWNPGNGNQLLVASSTKISVFTPSVENTVNVLEPIQEFDTQPLLLASWVHVPIKYKVETPNTNVWNESFSFGRKFGPDRPPAPPSPHAKASFVALSSDGIVYWGYLANDGSKWHLLHFPLRGYSQTFPSESPSQPGAYPGNASTTTAFALNTPCITRANFVFTSNTSARIALVSSTSPNSVSIYDIGVDYKKGELEVAKRPTSILTIPTSPLDAVSFFTQGASPNRSRASFQSVQDSWNAGHDSLFQQYTGPSLSSPRMGFAGGAPPLQTSSSTTGGQPTTPKTPSDGNVLGGNLAQIKDESPSWHSVHVDHEPLNAIQHISFDPYDSTTLYLVWHKFRRNQTGFERCSYLHRWHAVSQPLKVKCGLDLSKYMVSSETEQTQNETEEQVPQPNDGFNTSVADFDDSLAHENDDYNSIDPWGFDTKSSNQRNGTIGSTSATSSHLDDPNAENINNFFLSARNLNEDGNTNSTLASARPTNLVTETWECVSRTVILANTQILNPQLSTNSTSSMVGISRSTHTANSSNLSSSSETAATKGSQFGGQTGHSSNSGSNAPGSANTTHSSNHSNTHPQPISKFDSVTHMRVGRNIICMTMASGSTLILDSETFDIVVDYSTPHVWADSGSVQSSGTSQNTTNSNSASSTAPSSSSGTVPLSTKANTKKRPFDSVQHSPGAQWGLEMTTSPFSPQQTAFSSYDAFLAPSPISGSASYSSLPPNKRSKRSENTGIDLSSLHVTRGPSSWIPTTSGYHTIMSSNFPIAGCISPNQACCAVIFSDLSVRVFHLAPLLRYRTSVLTSQQLCIQVANLFEVSMMKRCTFWDIAAMFLALPEDVYHEQHLHRGVLILLARDIERIEPKVSVSSSYWRSSFELIKSAIYRSSPDMTYNFMLSQSILSLRRTVYLLNSTYRCAPYFRKVLDSPTLDHPDLSVLFSETHDFTQDTTRLERESIATTSPLSALKWVQAFTSWSMSIIEAFQTKATRHRLQSSEQNNQSQASGPSSFIADDAGFLSTSQQLSQPYSSVVATPASGSHMGAQTPNSIHTPGGLVTTPSGTIAHTPISANRMYESPHGSGSISSRTGTPAAVTQVMTPKTRASGGTGPSTSLISLPDWYSQLPIVPETLEELLMIIPDRNVEIGILWALDAPLLGLLKEALLYFTVAIHLDKVHPSGKLYLKQFTQPSFTSLHSLLQSQAMTLAHHSIKFITEDWITEQVIPALYAMNGVHARSPPHDSAALDLSPPRQRFLEFNFFHGNPLDPSSFPTQAGKTLNETNNDTKTFWHTTSTTPTPYLTPDTASLFEVKGEFCKKCTICNRMTNISPRHANDGVSLFVNACPICQAPWMIIKNPQLSNQR